MTTLAANSTVTLVLTDYDSVTITCRGPVTVEAVSGLGLTAGKIAEVQGTRTFGPFSAAGSLKLTTQGAPAEYEVADGATPGVPAMLAIDPLTGQVAGIQGAGGVMPFASIQTQHATDVYGVRSKGTLAVDWRVALSGTGYSVDATATCPTGAAVIAIPGEGTTDTTGNLQNNQCTVALGASISTANLSSLLVYARVPKRNPARKNYRNCLLSVLLAADAGFAKYLTYRFSARADGKWHAYSLDLANPSVNSGAFVVGTDLITTVRVRPEITNNDINNGTSQLQVGETAYYGGIVTAPRTKPLATIRFDDGLSSLYSRKACNVTSQFVGASGVTVEIGTYSIYELVTAFGFAGTCFLLSSKFGSSYTNYETVANLKTMQVAGWEMCWQTHYNPLSTSGLGARLLGFTGSPWLASQNLNHTAAGVITSPVHTFVRSYGETSQISPIGVPPAPLVAGQIYWPKPIAATTFTLHPTEKDAYEGTNIITFAADGSATWGWDHPHSATDGSAIDAEFAAGKAAMIANGLNGWMHWAPNQGACNGYTEDAWYNIGGETMWPINLGVATSALGMPTHISSLGLGNMTINPSAITTRSCAHLDDLTQAQARDYVRNICKVGGIGQGLLHEPSGSSVFTLLAYLDELKVRQDAGEIEVATPTRVKAYLDAVQL